MMSDLLLARPNSPFLDSQFGVTHRVLDHGFIRLADYMGNEEGICRAARVSYGKGTRSARENNDLIRYLLRHRHTSPLEQAEISIHVRLPIFVARQWIRHRMANVNEYSARYSILDREFYVPEFEQIAAQSTVNRQGRGAAFDAESAARVQELIRDHSNASYELYRLLLNEEEEDEDAPDPTRPGLARELARMSLTLNSYTQWYWKTDLHNLLHFLSLRMDPHAQYEIRVYADVIAQIVEGWVPNVWDAFKDYRLDAHTFSAQEMVLLRQAMGAVLRDNKLAAESDGVAFDVKAWRKNTADAFGLGSQRERSAFWAALGLDDASLKQ